MNSSNNQMKCNIPVQEEKELHVVVVTFCHVFDVQSAASEDPAKREGNLTLIACHLNLL